MYFHGLLAWRPGGDYRLYGCRPKSVSDGLVYGLSWTSACDAQRHWGGICDLRCSISELCLAGFYDVGTESTDGADTPRWKILERQDEVISINVLCYNLLKLNFCGNVLSCFCTLYVCINCTCFDALLFSGQQQVPFLTFWSLTFSAHCFCTLFNYLCYLGNHTRVHKKRKSIKGN